MSNKTYSDSVWKDKLTGEEFKKFRQVSMFLFAQFEVTIILLSPIPGAARSKA